MNKFYAILVALVVTLFASSSFAWNPPASPAPASWISDTSGVLSPEAHARLDAKLKVINQSSANEVAALVLPTLDGQDIRDVGIATTKAWGVGKKDLDNGVLVVLAMKEHKSAIETGKGVEGDLPDLKCSDILAQARPYLRKGDVEGALGFIFDSSASAIANHKAEAAALAAKKAAGGTADTSTSTPSRTSSCDVSGSLGLGGGDVGWLFVLALIGGGLLWWRLSVRAAQRRQLEELERQNREERHRQLRLNQEREANRRAEEARLQRERAASVSIPTPVVPVPSIPRPVAVPRPTPRHESHPVAVATGVSVAAGVALAAAEEEARRLRESEARRRREREEEESRRARERAEEDRRRREREEDDRRSSSSSSSSDWSSGGSWGGGSDSGSGGFGGGDSGGGGASGDW